MIKARAHQTRGQSKGKQHDHLDSIRFAKPQNPTTHAQHFFFAFAFFSFSWLFRAAGLSLFGMPSNRRRGARWPRIRSPKERACQLLRLRPRRLCRLCVMWYNRSAKPHHSRPPLAGSLRACLVLCVRRSSPARLATSEATTGARAPRATGAGEPTKDERSRRSSEKSFRFHQKEKGDDLDRGVSAFKPKRPRPLNLIGLLRLTHGHASQHTKTGTETS